MVETGVLAVLFPELATLLGAEAPTQLEAPPPTRRPTRRPRRRRPPAPAAPAGPDGAVRRPGPRAPAALSNAVVISVLALPLVGEASIDPDAQHVRDAGRAIEGLCGPVPDPAAHLAP